MTSSQIRHTFHELLHSSEVETPAQHWVRMTIASVISLSVLSVILETEPELELRYADYFHVFEIFTVAIFSLEYLLRLWCVVEDSGYTHPVWGRLKYAVTPLALIDLIAVLPFFLPAILPFDLRFLRILRLSRLIRVLKFGHYSRSLTMIHRIIRKKRPELAASLFIVVLLLISASSVEYYLEHDAQPKVFSSIPAAFWWGIATLTTVGYGDVVPITTAGKILSSIISVLGIGVFALPSGIIVLGFIEELSQKKETAVCDRCKQEISSSGVGNLEVLERNLVPVESP